MDRKKRVELAALALEKQVGVDFFKIIGGRSRDNSDNRDRFVYIMQDIGCSLEEIRGLIGWSHTNTVSVAIKRCIKRMHQSKDELSLVDDLRRASSL